MSSQIEIAKVAATRIGTDATITSLDDNRNLARTLKDVFEPQRRATLRDGSFNFSTKRARLAQLVLDANDIIYPFTSAYELPADFIRLLDIMSPTVGADFQIEGGRILCYHTGPLYIRYIWDVTELALWDESAAQAFGIRLAWKCGRKLAGSTFDQDACWKEYEEAIGKSGAVDAKENPPIEEAESDWVLARFVYGGA